MGAQLAVSITLTTIDCGCCGGSYAINERYRAKCQDDGTGWTCPYCKTGWGYVGNGNVEKLKREVAELKQQRIYAR